MADALVGYALPGTVEACAVQGLASATVMLACEVLGRFNLLRCVGKIYASSLFCLALFRAGVTPALVRQEWWALCYAVAFGCCALGDTCLLALRSGDFYFRCGLVSFLLGHLGYVGAFALLPQTGVANPLGVTTIASDRLALGLASMGGFVCLVHRLHLRHYVPARMRVPVAAYMLVIIAMAATSLEQRRSWLLTVCAVVFMISDVFVARAKFVAPEVATQAAKQAKLSTDAAARRVHWAVARDRATSMPLYFLAQFGFAIAAQHIVAGTDLSF